MVELSSSSGQAPFTPQITNLSENADTFQWDFGDGSAISTSRVPSHTYTTAGTFVLTLTAEGAGQPGTFTQTVTVEAGPVAEVKLQPAQPAVSVADSLRFFAKAFDQFGNQLTDVVLEWTASEACGTIDQSGFYMPTTVAGQYEQAVVVSATKAGQTQQVSANVSVSPGAPAEITVKPSQVLLDIGASQDMSLKVLDIFGNEVSNAPTLWESDDQAGSIDANGVFTAGTKSGSFRQGNRVNVVQGDTSLSETFEIFIRPDPLVSIKVDPSLPIVRKNETLRLQATGLDQYGNEILSLAFLWSSPEIDVSSSGTVTAGDQEGLYEVTVQASFRDLDQTTSFRVGVPPVWIPIEDMSRRRYAHSSTLLLDGRVLIAGGSQSSRSAELYDPATGTFGDTDRLTENRNHHSAVLLPDGKVLVVGGCNTQSVDVFDPEDGTFSPVQGNVMQPFRTSATATLLKNGKVLIAGGRSCGPAGWGESWNTAEIFDPATGLFTWTIGTMVRPRSDHRATLLHSGEVLLSGGFTRFEDDSFECLDSSELYDPVTSTFRETGLLIQGSGCTIDTNASAPLLPNGKVLLTLYRGRLELFDPTTEDVTLGSPWERRGGTSVTLLSDGRVLIAGGYTEGTEDRADLYDPIDDTIVSTTTMNTPRHLPTTAVLATGEVLLTGGRFQQEDGVWIYYRSAELFIP